MSSVTIVSFGDLHNHLYAGKPGYREEGAPVAEVVVDLRQRMRDPHHDPAMRELTGEHQAIVARVKNAPGAPQILGSLAMVAHAMTTGGVPVTIALGCAGGRHRSYVMAEWLASTLRFGGVEVSVVHRDVHLPVVQR